MFGNAPRQSIAFVTIVSAPRFAFYCVDTTRAAWKAGMTTIIIDNFKQQAESQEASSDLTGAGFATDQTTTFL